VVGPLPLSGLKICWHYCKTMPSLSLKDVDFQKASICKLCDLAIESSSRYCPLPLSGTVCLLPFALSVIVSVPVCSTAALGVNVTTIVQAAPAARVGGQSLVSVNIAGSEIISINTGSPGCFLLPLGLDTFKVFGLLGVPTVVFWNFSAFGLILSLTGTGVGGAVAVVVGVALGIADPVEVAVAVAVLVAVAVAVVVGVALGVTDPVEVAVAVAVLVAVLVAVSVGFGGPARSAISFAPTKLPNPVARSYPATAGYQPFVLPSLIS
jgi:hypothetical protein